jgi:hypothetical protein
MPQQDSDVMISTQNNCVLNNAHELVMNLGSECSEECLVNTIFYIEKISKLMSNFAKCIIYSLTRYTLRIIYIRFSVKKVIRIFFIPRLIVYQQKVNWKVVSVLN